MSSIRIQGLTKRYGTVAAAYEVSFDVPSGGTIALLGPSGCGKTTILRCLAGLETPDWGTIEIDGEPVFDRANNIDLPPERRGEGLGLLGIVSGVPAVIALPAGVWLAGHHLAAAAGVRQPRRVLPGMGLETATGFGARRRVRAGS